MATIANVPECPYLNQNENVKINIQLKSHKQEETNCGVTESKPKTKRKKKWSNDDPPFVDDYEDYLKLDQVLVAERLTDEKESHDEHLFIIVHQTFELWFKQILYEIGSIIPLLEHQLCERIQIRILHRINRINVIFRIMVQQFEILETMGCVNFAAFRDMFTASGFQSMQFKLLEIKLGIELQNRGCTFLKNYNSKLTDEQRHLLEEAATQPSLSKAIEEWLARTPAVLLFIDSYKHTIENDFLNILKNAENESDPARKEELLEEAASLKEHFSMVFDTDKYSLSKKSRNIELSHMAFWGAIMITSHCEEPRFAVPSEILKGLMDMDALFCKWRFSHAMMAKKMIGSKRGTGGSSGYHYLRSTVSDRYMPFKDLFEVASFILPPQKTPPLTPEMYAEISQIYIIETEKTT